MKKFIPYLFLAIGVINLQNCRSDEEVTNQNEELKTIESLGKNSDSAKLKQELEPDPPIKDGQDWKH